MNKTEFIAKIRHIGWVAFQIAVNQEYNEEPNEDQLKSLMDGVDYLLKHPNASAVISKRYRNRNPQQVRVRRKRYRETHPWAHHADRINKKAEKVIVTQDDLHEIWKQQNGKCIYCGKQLELIAKVHRQDKTRFGEIHFDHVMPGINTKGNLVVSCFGCNRKKSDNTIDDLNRFLKVMENFGN